MENIQNITIDIMNNKYSDYIYCKQFDNNRTVNFTITENGIPKALDDTYCTFLMKGDGVISFQSLVRVGNVYQMTITHNETPVSGKIPYQLVLTSGEVTIDDEGKIVWEEGSSLIGTVTSYVVVEKCVINADDAEMQQDASILEQLLAEVKSAQEVVTEIEQLNEEGEGYANTAKSWAIGEGGIRPGEDEDNAKYYSQEAMLHSENAEYYMTGARISSEHSANFARQAEETFDEIKHKVAFSKLITLPAANWSQQYHTQNVPVEGVESDQSEQLITVQPAEGSIEEYALCNVMCIQQSTNQLTFKCEDIPSTDLNVYVFLQGVKIGNQNDVSFSIISDTEPECSVGDFWYQDYE